MRNHLPVLPLLLPQFGYEWMGSLADVLPVTGAAFLLPGWLRLLRDNANR